MGAWVSYLLQQIGFSADRSGTVVVLGLDNAGKSTLLNRILRGDHGRRIAVIENEFGEGLEIESLIAKDGVALEGGVGEGEEGAGGRSGGVAAEFTTSALDGKVAFWTRDQLSAAMKGLAIAVD